MKETIKRFRFWLKDRWNYMILGGKCLRCGGKLHLNALGFHNCGKCWHEYLQKELGEYEQDI